VDRLGSSLIGLLVMMAVVNVQTGRFKPRRAGDLPIELNGFRPRCHAGPIHAGIQIQQDADRPRGTSHCQAQLFHGTGVVGGHGELDVGIGLDKARDAGNVRSDRVVGQQDVPHAGQGQHLGFGQRGALVARDASCELPFGDLADLVRLAVRPQTLGTACHADHQTEIRLDDLAEDQQGGRDDVASVVYGVARFHNPRFRKAGLPDGPIVGMAV
jgi:hypothetical protein